MILERQTEITGETCVRQIKAMRDTYIDETYEHCRNCQNRCDNYLPVKIFEIPLNPVRFKC